MLKKTKFTICLVFKIIQNKPRFLFWLFIRFFSSLLPLLTIYLFSKVISDIETNTIFSSIFFLILLILVVRIVDNYTRLRSLFKLDECISDIIFDVHNFFTKDLKTETKEDRHQSVQAIRNFSDASSLTLSLFRQPGMDSIVSLFVIPAILFFVDFKVFVLEIAYILIYMVIDYYTTQNYIKFRDFQNTKTETYYAKLQESNDIDLEQKTYTRHFTRLCNWNFIEWSLLQNSSVLFYIIILSYCIIAVTSGFKHISDIVLIMGYVTSTQTFLNSFSDIKDSLANMTVALDHLAKNKFISVVDLDDLV
jgi:ABC-type multidrug transport system fused ATPase/permease subunit